MFKVGDRVKLIKMTTCTCGFEIGEIYTIAHLDSLGRHKIRIEDNKGVSGYVNEEHIEKVQFTKSDLKDGDIVTYRNGNKRIVQGERLRTLDGDNGYELQGYREDLTEKYNDTVLDIIKVERPTKYETVFERKEEILDKAEKRYLRDVIRPFKGRVESITKEVYNSYYETSHIVIRTSANKIEFPPLKKEKKMYEGMELGREYSLEELGL